MDKLRSLISNVFQNLKEDSYPRGFKRIYPSGGAIYEIDPVIHSLDDRILSCGSYHYNFEKKDFDLIEQKDFEIFEFSETKPKIIISLVADLKLLPIKYDNISYKITLQNSGVIISYLALMATALGLKIRPIGIELNALNLGKDKLPVGEVWVY